MVFFPLTGIWKHVSGDASAAGIKTTTNPISHNPRESITKPGHSGQAWVKLTLSVQTLAERENPDLGGLAVFPELHSLRQGPLLREIMEGEWFEEGGRQDRFTMESQP